MVVPHRNRTRFLGDLPCAFHNGRDARCVSCAAKMAAFPVRPLVAAKMAAFPVRPFVAAKMAAFPVRPLVAAKMAAFPVNAAFQTVLIAGNNSKYTRKRHIKTKTMLSALYLDIQARRAVTFCRFSGTLFVSGNRQIVLLNLVFKCHSRWYGWHLNQLKAILNFLLRWRCL